MAHYAKRVITAVLVFLLVMPTMLFDVKPVLAGATIIVDTTIDEAGTGSHCSLREAIYAANEDEAYGGCVAGNGLDTIRLLADIYELTIKTNGFDENDGKTGDLDIYNDLVITGVGFKSTNIIGIRDEVNEENDFDDRIFHIFPKDGRTTPLKVTIEGVSISGGNRSSRAGGGILNDGGIVTLSWVKVSSNTAKYGGGIANLLDSKLVINNSSVVSNTAAGVTSTGGGIHNEGTMIISTSLFKGNSATIGGAIENRPANPNDYGLISNSTIAVNTGVDSGAGISAAGPGKLILQNCTIAKNTGSGIFMWNNSILEIKNSIIAKNSVSPDCKVAAVSGTLKVTITSQGYNLIDDANDDSNLNQCKFEDTTSLIGPTYDPMFSDTLVVKHFTEVLEFDDLDSPAIDAIPAGDPNCSHVDQLLHGRPAEGNGDDSIGCDIGAYEVNGIFFTTLLPLVSR